MFAFGDKEWPGLTKLNEESGELGAWGGYPLRRGMTRAQRKADKARLLKDQTDPLVRLACEPRYSWRSASRTHAAVSCMTCLVAAARLGR